VASSDARANAVDEIQYGAGEGPCLEALRAGEVVRVDNLATERRWGGYRELALQAGVRSSLSFPLIVRGRPLGALNVYSVEVGPWPADQEAAAILASSQAAGILQAVRGLAANLVRDPDAARGLQDRHELDVATGMLMAVHGYDAGQARTALAEQAAARDISVHTLVAQLMKRYPGSPTPRTGLPEGGPA
jgi:GAF domain-containing protein